MFRSVCFDDVVPFSFVYQMLYFFVPIMIYILHTITAPERIGMTVTSAFTGLLIVNSLLICFPVV